MKGWLVAGACTLAVAAAAACVAVGTERTAEPAGPAPDTIVHHGRIATMDGRGTTVAGAGHPRRRRSSPPGATRRSGRWRARRRARSTSAAAACCRASSTPACAACDGRRTSASRARRGSTACTQRTEALRTVADRAQRTPAGQVAVLDRRAAGTSGSSTRRGCSRRPSWTRSRRPIPSTCRPPASRAASSTAWRCARSACEAGDPGVVRDSAGAATGQVTGPANARALRAVAARARHARRSTSGRRARGSSCASSTGAA